MRGCRAHKLLTRSRRPGRHGPPRRIGHLTVPPGRYFRSAFAGLPSIEPGRCFRPVSGGLPPIVLGGGFLTAQQARRRSLLTPPPSGRRNRPKTSSTTGRLSRQSLLGVEKAFRMSKSDPQGLAGLSPQARPDRRAPDDRAHRLGRQPLDRDHHRLEHQEIRPHRPPLPHHHHPGRPHTITAANPVPDHLRAALTLAFHPGCSADGASTVKGAPELGR